MKLSDFESGFCPSSEVKGWRHDTEGIAQVTAWIDAGWLFEEHTTQPSARMGKLWLTDAGRLKAGLGPVVKTEARAVKPKQIETQRGFAFDD